MKYKFKTMRANDALQILLKLVKELDGIDPDDLTTFEINLLGKCVDNPPRSVRGKEQRILDND